MPELITAAPAAATTTTTNTAPATSGASENSGGGATATGATTQNVHTEGGGQSQTFTPPAELLDWGANKGLDKTLMTDLYTKHPEIYKMATSYRDTEKMVGADKIVMPKDLNDMAQVAPALDRLGAPKSGADYKIEMPQGGDSDFVLKAGEMFAANKILPSQATGLVKAYNDYATSRMQADAAQEHTKAVTELDALSKEWGTADPINKEVSARGFGQLQKAIGMTPERAEALKTGDSAKLTAAEFVRITKYIGDLVKVNGDTFETSGADKTGTGGGMTADAAKAEITRLESDGAFARKLLSNDADAKKKMDDLYKLAGGGGVTKIV